MPPPKLAQKSGGQASAFARGCAERLRAIEARLDHGLSSRWLRDVDAAEDVAAVAGLLLALQSAAKLGAAEPEPWLEQLRSRALDEEAQSENSRRLTRRLDELDRAVPPARSPADMLGEVVLKHFDGHGTYMGTIVEFDATTGFRLQVRRARGGGAGRSPSAACAAPRPPPPHATLAPPPPPPRARAAPPPPPPRTRASTTTATPRTSPFATCAP